MRILVKWRIWKSLNLLKEIIKLQDYKEIRELVRLDKIENYETIRKEEKWNFIRRVQ